MEQFEEWLRFVFDHPVRARKTQAWYWDDGLESEFERWASDATLNVGRVTRVFREPSSLAGFSRDQVAQGLWFLLGPTPCDIDSDPYDPAVEHRLRAECLEAASSFFATYLAAECRRAAPTYRDESADELAVTCFMWWDLWPRRGRHKASPDGDAVDAAILDTLAAIGAIPSVSCVESALHGLGHRHETHPERVERIVDALLGRSSDWPPALVQYAQAARRGDVQ